MGGEHPLGSESLVLAPKNVPGKSKPCFRQVFSLYSRQLSEQSRGIYMGDLTDLQFSELLKLCSLTKTALAEELGLALETIVRWGEDAPKYARAYLELKLSWNELRDFKTMILMTWDTLNELSHNR